MDNVWILAQTQQGTTPSRVPSEPIQTQGEATTTVPGGPTDTKGTEAGRTGQPQMWNMLFLFLLMAVLMYFVLFRGPRKQQQQHRQMAESLKKNDRVRTIGGIFGTIVDVRGDEVVLKVDESNNTKIRVSLSAISKRLTEDGKE
jgi:preprotein translocase subunit YajC